MKVGRIVMGAFAFAALFGASQASAQTIGFKAGVSFANLSFDGDDNTESLTGFTGGGFVRFGMGPVSIQPELMFVTKGTEETVTEGELEFTSKLKLNYVEVPVLVVLPIATGSGIAPYLYGGPNIAFKVGCTAELTGDEGEISGDCGDEVDVKSTDIGGTIGGGLTFPAGPGALLIEGRYTFGLTNISGSEGDDVKTRTAQIMAGYQVPIGPRM